MRKNHTVRLIMIAMLVAFDVVFSRVAAINTSTMKIGLGFVAIVLCAMLYGPVWAGVAAGLSDLVGALIFPTGAYFPGFTLTAALSGVIFGLFLYRQRPNFLRSLLAAFLNNLLITLFANTAMISFVFGPPFWPLFTLRLAQFAVMLVLQTAVITALSSSNTLYGKINELKSR
ncbi:MAG: folate family ECF transporter S component [Oscillospiraceae bacterium]|nr:folate family ECF transporter S component [Oscillospiraceae bacterium]